MNRLLLQRPSRTVQKCLIQYANHNVIASTSFRAARVNRLKYVRFQSTKAEQASTPTHDPVTNTTNTISASPQLAVKGIVGSLETTRPAALNVPEAPHDLAWPSSKSLDPSKWDFGYLFKLGKAYVYFYYTGMKNVWANYKTMRAIQSRIKSSGCSMDEAVRSSQAPERVSYAEYELCIRTQRDVKKMIPFGLIFAVCGEFTPLVIVALGSAVVPPNCVIPKQQLADTKAMLEREDVYLRERAVLRRTWPSEYSLPPDQALESYRLGLRSLRSLNPWVRDLFRGRRLRQLHSHCLTVLNSAILIKREGGWQVKTPQDMWEWGLRYGMYGMREYAREALADGKEIVSEEMKQALLPTFEEELDKIIETAQMSSPEMLWMAAMHTSLFNDRSDCKAMEQRILEMSQSKKDL